MSNRLFLRLPDLVDAARGAEADLDCVGLEVVVLGLAGVSDARRRSTVDRQPLPAEPFAGMSGRAAIAAILDAALS